MEKGYLFIKTVASTKEFGIRVRRYQETTSFSMILSMRTKAGTTASAKIEDSTMNVTMESNQPAKHKLPTIQKESRASHQEHTIQVMATLIQ
jgi:hypothetical protein